MSAANQRNRRNNGKPGIGIMALMSKWRWLMASAASVMKMKAQWHQRSISSLQRQRS
jgi:hypothetical protein